MLLTCSPIRAYSRLSIRNVPQGTQTMPCDPARVHLRVGLVGLSHYPCRHTTSRGTRCPSIHAPPQNRIRGCHDAVSPHQDIHSRARCLPLRCEPVQPSRWRVHPHVPGQFSCLDLISELYLTYVDYIGTRYSCFTCLSIYVQ